MTNPARQSSDCRNALRRSVRAHIPLAADVVGKGAEALDPRGELYTAVNVGERHAMRNMIDEMRGAGHVMRGPSGLTARNRQEFANQLDRWLARVKKAAQLKGPGPESTAVSAEE